MTPVKRPFLAAICLVMGACGFQFTNPVEECPSTGCPAEDAGISDAGSADAGFVFQEDPRWIGETIYEGRSDYYKPTLALSSGSSPMVTFGLDWDIHGAFKGQGGWEHHPVNVAHGAQTARALPTLEYPSLGWHNSVAHGYAEWRDGAWDIYRFGDEQPEGQCLAPAAFDRGLGSSVHSVIGCSGVLVHRYWDGDRSILNVVEEQIASITNPAYEVALQVDSAGRPHVLYAEENGRELIYATRSDDAWIVETAVSNFAGETLHMALGDSEQPVACYAQRGPSLNSYGVRCVGLVQGQWVTSEVVPSRRARITVGGVVVDTEGRTQLTYLEENFLDEAGLTSRLVFVKQAGDGWEEVPVAELTDSRSANFLGNGALQLDQDDVPWIVYGEQRAVRLVHLREP